MMSIVLELTPEEEVILQKEAMQQKIDVVSYVRQRIFPARSELKEVDLLRDFATESVKEAREGLHAKGIGYVESQGDKVVRCLPDGSVEVIASLKSNKIAK
jgi:hypothetical protein